MGLKSNRRIFIKTKNIFNKNYIVIERAQKYRVITIQKQILII